MPPKLSLMAATLIAPIAVAASGQSKTDSPAMSGTPLARAKFAAGMEAEFRRMDVDKNGRLSKEEIEQFQRTQLAAQAQARNKALFVHLDVDGNGQLSPAEFSKVATPAPAANAQPILARMDGNRDAQISLAEHRSATLANFDRIDADRDGVVTAAELKAGGLSPR